MQTYTLPRETFNLFLEMFGEQQKAEIVARTLESWPLTTKPPRELSRKKR
jgi:hypothetical protein